MAFVPTYPGVYINEIPSGSRSIAGASTSIASFAGSFARGPVNTPIRLFSAAEFENEFGGANAAFPTSFAVDQFFINGGGTAYAIRVAPDDADSADMTIRDEAGATTLTAMAGRFINDAAVESPGEWGNNLRIDVDYRASDPVNEFNLIVSEIREDGGVETAVRTEVFRNLTMAAGPRNAVDVVNAGSQLITLSRNGNAGRPARTGLHSADIPAANLAALTTSETINIDLGTGTQTVTVDFSAGAPTDLAAAARVLEGAIRSAFPANRLFAQASVAVNGGQLRVAPGRNSPDYNPQHVVVLTDDSGTIVADLLLDAANATSNVEQYLPTGSAVPVAFFEASTQGTDGSALDAAALAGDRGARSSFYALDDVDAFNMLAIPEAANLGSVANLAAVMAPALTFCVEKRAMLFIDPPPGLNSLPEAENWLDDIAGAGLRSPNSVSYYPRLRVPDPINGGRLLEVAPSGTLSGVWARTDGEVGVWKAPAGTTASLRGVPELIHVLTDPQNGVLNPQGLNALRKFDIPGNVSWGARTLMGADLLASDWKYIPVRRTALFIESSLFNGLQWAVFQPNAEPLWLEIRGAVTSFMQGLFRQGAFKGTSPREAFVVRCGADTTTQADINAGIVNVFVGFAPLQPAEFVVVNLQLQLQQAA